MIPFPRVPVTVRTAKPRRTGLTITADFGLGPLAQEDLLRTCGETVDLAKLVVGVSAMLPFDVLAEKVTVYREHGVEAFPGGMFLEHAVFRDAADAFLDGAQEAGYRVVEVSENARPLGEEVKAKLVAAALERGLTVLGEVGSKHHRTGPAELVEGARRLLDHGCWKVLIEAAELVRADVLEAVEAALPIGDVVFELPGPWIPGIHHHEVQAMQLMLVRRFGPDVNLANVASEDALFLEATRRGIGPNAVTG
ncbi:phosphosulfolactate synthase [Nonomuraea sediminis]|uniref:phosphosulfolactate synthase n=1 Tax=Nonomuraea sediminis TaxID=2835864 RepID=UPI001BDBDA0E|nr:phosphosulfolactate synthase [Nonomuraea sediminis]